MHYYLRIPIKCLREQTQKGKISKIIIYIHIYKDKKQRIYILTATPFSSEDFFLHIGVP